MDRRHLTDTNRILSKAVGLLEAAGNSNARMEVRWLFAAVLQIRPSILFASPELEVSTQKLEQFWEWVSERRQGRPLAYIIGEQPFHELDFRVNESVLIPRPETEELVEHCLRKMESMGRPGRILDLCCGSGCIGLSLLHSHRDWRLVLSDLSSDALEVAKQNALRHFPGHGLRTLCDAGLWDDPAGAASTGSAPFPLEGGPSSKPEICLLRSDLYEAIPATLRWECIVANPPYIHPDERDSLDPSVKDFEPEMALFCEDPIRMYQELLEGAAGRLTSDGFFMAELSERWSDRVIDMACGLFRESRILQDSSGKERFVLAADAKNRS